MLWHVMGANPQAPGILQSYRSGATICSPCCCQIAIGDGVLWTTCKRKAKPEAQLGDSHSESDEPRRVGCGNPHQIPHPSYSIYWGYSYYPLQNKQHSLLVMHPRHTIFAKAVFSFLNERAVPNRQFLYPLLKI